MLGKVIADPCRHLLAPGDRHPVEVSFTPSLESNYAGEIWADSNTPAGRRRPTSQPHPSKSQWPSAALRQKTVRPVRHGHLHRLRLLRPQWRRNRGRVGGYLKPEVVGMPSGTGLTARARPDCWRLRGRVGRDERQRRELDPCYTRQKRYCRRTLRDVPDAADDMDLHLLGPGAPCSQPMTATTPTRAGLEWARRASKQLSPTSTISRHRARKHQHPRARRRTYTVVVHDYYGSTPDYYGPTRSP